MNAYPNKHLTVALCLSLHIQVQLSNEILAYHTYIDTEKKLYTASVKKTM